MSAYARQPLYLALALTLSGCSLIDTHRAPPADWPALAVTEHHVSFSAMYRACAPYAGFGALPVGCSVIFFERGTCEIFAPDLDAETLALLIEHERAHCAGHDHIGASTLAEGWQAYKARRQLDHI